LFERIAIHAPFWDILPFAPNPATRTASRRQLLRTVAASGQIGAETVTTHVIPRTGRDLSDFRQDVVDFYRELGDVAANAGLTVTIETGYPPGIGQFASLIHEIGHPAIGANVDVGHLRGLVTEDEREAPAIVAAYNDLLARHMDSLGERIYHVHLHDVQVEGLRDHRECGSGIIDYEAIFRRLLEVGYSGMMTFELEEADAEGSLRRSRRVVVEAARDASKPRGA
jgi:sugar phosphate isomerase/epimerase